MALTTTGGNATAADYQAALRSATYSFAGDPTVGGTDKTRLISIDSVCKSAGKTRTSHIVITGSLGKALSLI